MSKRPIGALAPWFGSARSSPKRIGVELGKLAWCGVGFAGGMPELPHIDTRAGLANDLHRHVINLAKAVRKDPEQLQAMLDSLLFHPDELAAAQRRCLQREEPVSCLFGEARFAPVEDPDMQWAADYFVCAWMARGGHAGKATEFGQGLSFRFTSSGGASSVRYQSAVESIRGWADALKHWEFSTMDAIEFIDRVHDDNGHGLYLDPPWPDLGEEYRHRVSEAFHARLATAVMRFERARVVIRYGVHPLIERLYPKDLWTHVQMETVNQMGNAVNEVLIVNGPSFAKDGGK